MQMCKSRSTKKANETARVCYLCAHILFTFLKYKQTNQQIAQWGTVTLYRLVVSALQLKNAIQSVNVCSFHFIDKKPLITIYLNYTCERKAEKMLLRCTSTLSSAANTLFTRISVRLWKRKSSANWSGNSNLSYRLLNKSFWWSLPTFKVSMFLWDSKND